MKLLFNILLLITVISCTKMSFTIKEADFSNKKNWGTLDYHNYWSSLQYADTLYYRNIAKTMDKQYFAMGMQSLVRSDRYHARRYFEETLNITTNDTLKRYSNWHLTELYEFDEKWEKAFKIRLRNYDYKDIPDSVEVFKKENFAHQMSKIEKTEVVYTEKPDTLKMEITYGLPMVVLNVNGEEYEMLFDTGFELTTFSDELAEQFEFHSNEVPGRTVASTGLELASKFSNIKEFKLGKTIIKNHPCSIIAKEYFYINLFLGIFAIDFHGAIGLNFIKYFDVTMDFENEIIILKKPKKKSVKVRNFYWLDYPIIRAITPIGGELNFYFDSGSNISHIRDALLKKLVFPNIEETQKIRYGVGGEKEFTMKIVPQFDLIVRDKVIEFDNIMTYGLEKGFIILDGTLGSDIGKGRKLHFDLTNGIFEILE